LAQSDRKRRSEIEEHFANGRGLAILARSVLGPGAKGESIHPTVSVLLLQLFGGVDKRDERGSMRARGDVDILLYDPSPDTLVLANRIWSLAPSSHLIDLNLVASDDVQRTVEQAEGEIRDGVAVMDNFPLGSCRGHQVNYFLEDVQYGSHPSFDRRVAHLAVSRSTCPDDLYDLDADLATLHRVFDLVVCERRDASEAAERAKVMVHLFTERDQEHAQRRHLASMSLDESGAEVTHELLKEYVAHARASHHPSFSAEDRAVLEARLKQDLFPAEPGAERLVPTAIKLAEARARAWLRDHVSEDDIDLAVKLVAHHLDSERRRFAGPAVPEDRAAVHDHVHEHEIVDEPRGPQRLFSVQEPVFHLEDVVLSERNQREINELLAELRHQDLMYNRWGLGKTIKKRRGVRILFVGAPGTGKTITCEAIANLLGKKMLPVNYAELEDKYVGETEKNIVAAFKEAREKGAILLLDEADAVLYQRSGLERSFSNRDVSVLLREIDNFEGILVMTSNLSQLMDQALNRRLDAVVEFEFPDERLRGRLWRKKLPEEVPLAPDVDISRIASRYPLSGAQIENCIRSAVRTALLSAEDPEKATVAREHFEKAAKREMEKGDVMAKPYLSPSQKRIEGYK
jgi:AAA+ superfamily predicted ATPase